MMILLYIILETTSIQRYLQQCVLLLCGRSFGIDDDTTEQQQNITSKIEIVLLFLSYL
jgi:hypothetical protein